MRGCHRTSRISGEAGFALVEALVGAVVLIVIAVATLGAIDRAQSTSAFAKNRSVAAALAEQDQARLRGLPTASLSTYRINHTASRVVTVNGLNYTVASTVDWVHDSTGATPSCSASETTQADYLKLTSTVSANAIKPVTLTSLSAPPLAYSSSRGTLVVKVADGATPAQPVPDVSVSITGPTSMSDTTNSLGCAVFSFIPAGDYTVEIFKDGWVDEAGTTNPEKSKTVVGGALATLPFTYDSAGKVTVKFETNTGSSNFPSRGWTTSGFHTQVPGTQLRPFSVAATAAPQASLDMTNLFPFRTAYKIFAGQCASSNPENAIPSSTWFTTGPGSGDAIIVAPGGTGTVTVFQPALKLTVRNGSSALANANVVLTPTDTACTTHLVLSTDTSGRVNKGSFDFGSPYGTVAYDPGVPFGRYNLCVDAVAGSPATRRKYQTSINVNSTSGLSLFDVNLAAASPTFTQCS
jgi:Tfp pilus assembly protein PilV